MPPRQRKADWGLKDLSLQGTWGNGKMLRLFDFLERAQTSPKITDVHVHVSTNLLSSSSIYKSCYLLPIKICLPIFVVATELQFITLHESIHVINLSLRCNLRE